MKDSSYFHALNREDMQQIEYITKRIGIWAAWLNVPLVVIICYDVFMRYMFSETSVWILELEWHLFALIFLFGSAYAFQNDRHVRVDVFYDSASPKTQSIINITGILLFLLPWIALVIWESSIYTSTSFQILEGSPDPGGLPARFVLKACIPLSFCLLGLQAIAELVKNARVLTGE